MRVLLSTTGSRGDVQPMIAVALAVRDSGHAVHLCVPPDFRPWIESLGLTMTALGPALRSTGKANALAAPPTQEQQRQMREALLVDQFATLTATAAGCDVMLGATALQLAAPSVAERLGIPYVFAAFCPTVIPSLHHAPPVLAMLGDQPAPANADHRALWQSDARRWNEMWGTALNAQRALLGLPAVTDVRSHVLTQRPWLAADATLAPWPGSASPSTTAVFQSGAWHLRDESPLPAELIAFLDAGEPPIYFGFGSIRAPEGVSAAMIAAARALGRRAIVSRGWAELALIDAEPDCLSIGDVNHAALFARVAAVVHHGGAGTTTAAARAGAPQVIIPQHYDQHYWAARVQHLQIGAAHAPGIPTTDSLTESLAQALLPARASRARTVAAVMRTDGAVVAARALV